MLENFSSLKTEGAYGQKQHSRYWCFVRVTSLKVAGNALHCGIESKFWLEFNKLNLKSIATPVSEMGFANQRCEFLFKSMREHWKMLSVKNILKLRFSKYLWVFDHWSFIKSYEVSSTHLMSKTMSRFCSPTYHWLSVRCQCSRCKSTTAEIFFSLKFSRRFSYLIKSHIL